MYVCMYVCMYICNHIGSHFSRSPLYITLICISIIATNTKSGPGIRGWEYESGKREDENERATLSGWK